MSIFEEWSYQILSKEVWKENDIQSALKEWYELYKKVKWTPLENKFQKEYEDLFNSINESWENDKQISREERARIIFELWDIVNLAWKNWIIESKSFWSKWWDKAKWTNTQEAKESAIDLRDKDVKDYSKEEAIAAMNYLSNNYKKYKGIEKDDNISKWITFNYSSINELDDQYEVNKFQDILKTKIFWWKDLFNKDFLLWFNNERWNYLVKIKDFEQELQTKDIKDINSLALSNYFLYLDKIGWWITSEKLIKSFKPDSILWLKELWLDKNDENDSKKQIAKEILSKNWVLGKIKNLIETFSTTDSLLNSLQTNNTWIKISEEEKKENLKLALIFIDRNINWIKDKLKNDIKEKLKKSNPSMKDWEIENIAKELIEKVSKYKKPEDIPEVLKIFNEYDEKYNIWLDITKSTKDSVLLQKAKAKENFLISHTDLIKAQESWDEEWILKAKKELEKRSQELKDAEISVKVSSKLTEEKSKDLISWKTNYEEFIAEERKKDKAFDEEFKKYEEERTKYYEKYPEEKIVQTWKIDISEKWDKTEEIIYNQTSTWFEIIINEEKKEFFKLSQEEFNSLQNNKEALTSVIDFYKELSELWLSFVWDYRNFFIKSIQNFKINNWLSKNEILTIYNFIWTQIWKTWKDIRDARSDFKDLNIWKDILCKITWEDLTIPESKLSSSYKWVVFAYLNKNWYFDKWVVIENKWKKD